MTANIKSQTQTNAQAVDLIPEADAAKQQAAAVSTPKAAPEKQPSKPAAKPAAAPKAAPVKSDPTPVLARVSLGMVITLDLTQAERFEGLNADVKGQLQKFKVEGSEDSHDLFNPFRAISKKTRAKDPTAARGVIRNAMSTVLGIAAEVENQNITVLGKRSDVVTLLNRTAESLRQRVESALGIDPNAVVAVLNPGSPASEGQPEVEPSYLYMRDLVQVSAWANTNAKSLDLSENTDNLITSNIFVNVRVSAPHLYVAEEKDNAVNHIKNFLLNSAEKFANAPLILLAVNLRPNVLADMSYVDMLSTLNSSGYDLYDRAELTALAESGEADWVPNAKELASTLLAPNGDILCLTVVAEEVEGEEGEEAEAEAEAE